MQLSVPYPPKPFSPFWAPPVANANFCEEDYNLTPYVAEAANTFSNLVYVYYAVHRLMTGPSKSLAATLPYYGLLIVGITSAWFHGVLSFEGQMADELSMLYATVLALHRTLTFDSSPLVQTIMGLVLFGGVSAISAYHVIADELVVHRVSFAVLLLWTTLRITQLIPRCDATAAEKRRMKQTAALSAGAVIAAFAIWNIDNEFCGYLRAWRRKVGLPWGLISEGHAWWHIGTGVGVYGLAVLVELVTGGYTEGNWAWPLSVYVKDGSAKDDKSEVKNKAANGSKKRR